ncbi:MAG TPA: MFS transporter [Terracidiphilus sp.]|jgi:ACS family hexuronate transporter-like MFS transporter|nr:MFS transporter [Terracidiphilus sp.]
MSSETTQDTDLEYNQSLSSMRWTICAMLFAATTINYMDRQVIAILKPTIQHSIGMSEIAYGYVVDAFQFAYAAGLLLAGRFVDKIGTRISYMVVMAVWSLSAMGHALANTVLEFGIARFSLGLGESGNFPVAIKTVAEWFPQRERSLATGIFNSGANVGAVLAPLLVPWVAAKFGWHAGFLITGVFSALWIVWWFFKYRPTVAAATAGAAPAKPASPIRWISLVGYRQTWAFALGKFLTDPIWWFYLFWLPSFFSTKYHLDLSHLGLPLILVYNGSAVGSIGGGWLPVPFRKLGFSPAKARLSAMLVCACAVVPVFFINYTHSEWVAVALLALAAGAHQGWSANIFSTVSDMFPSRAVGSVTGIGGMAGSVGGMLIATFAGYVLQFSHNNYASLFAIAASAYLIALAVIVTLAPGLRKVELPA